MYKMIKTVRLSLIYCAMMLLLSIHPLNALALEAESTPAPQEPVSTSELETASTPVEQPGNTETPSSSVENTIEPAPSAQPAVENTSDKPAEPPVTYKYNPETKHWDSNEWVYNPSTRKYERPAPPAQLGQPSSLVASTPSAGPSAINSTQNHNSTLDATTINAIANAVNSNSLTGNAGVTGNTVGGNATTGNASAAATIINNVNSSVGNANNQQAANFVSNVMGDVHGDIMLQPMLLKAMLEAGVNSSQNVSSQNTTNASTTNTLTNDINLNATSGNASVTGNTRAGDATSGDADTVANVLNIVNSMISANRSFIGTINIYGSLDGDILLAPDFIPQMLANNGRVNSSNTSVDASSSVSSNDTQSIVNNVALAAQSGRAAVEGNTEAGNATTGNADTNVVMFNLTGHEIIASNSLLVFVNVLGKWVGVIIDAPTGATAAAIGNGVTQNTTTIAPNLVLDATNNTAITNNINLSSISGDATVARNTRAGNATTGNATASANIGNISNTKVGLSDWFGILFINVFGSWNGSFGLDTASGNRTLPAGQGAVTANSRDNEQPQVIKFVPNASVRSKRPSPAVVLVSSTGNGSYTTTNINDQSAAQLASTAKKSTSNSAESNIRSALPKMSRSARSWFISQFSLIGGIISLIGLAIVGLGTHSGFRGRTRSLK